MSNLRVLTRSCIRVLNYVKSPQIFPARGIKRWVAPTLIELEMRRRKSLPPPPRTAFVEWNYKSEWNAFGKRLNEEFNEDTLQLAFTHRSYIIKEEETQKEAGIENPEVILEDNRKLIEEGQTFMKEYTRKYVSLLLPTFPEEGIRAICDHLLEEKNLAYVSQNLGTKDLILCADHPPDQETYASTLIAIVGALLESSGAERAGLFVRDFIVTQLTEKDVNELWSLEDPLAALTNIITKEGRGIPEPRLINETGCNTILACYQVALYSDKQFLGSGSAETIQLAVQLAAQDALKRLFKTTDNMSPFSFKMNPYSNDVQTVNHVSISEWSAKNIVNC